MGVYRNFLCVKFNPCFSSRVNAFGELRISGFCHLDQIFMNCQHFLLHFLETACCCFKGNPGKDNHGLSYNIIVSCDLFLGFPPDYLQFSC